jgi:hypothetical protein
MEVVGHRQEVEAGRFSSASLSDELERTELLARQGVPPSCHRQIANRSRDRQPRPDVGSSRGTVSVLRPIARATRWSASRNGWSWRRASSGSWSKGTIARCSPWSVRIFRAAHASRACRRSVPARSAANAAKRADESQRSSPVDESVPDAAGCQTSNWRSRHCPHRGRGDPLPVTGQRAASRVERTKS